MKKRRLLLILSAACSLAMISCESHGKRQSCGVCGGTGKDYSIQYRHPGSCYHSDYYSNESYQHTLTGECRTYTYSPCNRCGGRGWIPPEQSADSDNSHSE